MDHEKSVVAMTGDYVPQAPNQPIRSCPLKSGIETLRELADLQLIKAQPISCIAPPAKARRHYGMPPLGMPFASRYYTANQISIS